MIGKNIRRLRQEMELSQQALAKELHVTQGAISQWEKGSSSPDTNQLISIAQFFSVSIDALVGDDVPIMKKTGESLSRTESKLIADFRSLNNDGKEHVLDYMCAMCIVYKKLALSPDAERA